jgi:hypothetical protein
MINLPYIFFPSPFLSVIRNIYYEQRYRFAFLGFFLVLLPDGMMFLESLDFKDSAEDETTKNF